MDRLTEVLDQVPERARAEDQNESPLDQREEVRENVRENVCEDAPEDVRENCPEELEEPEGGEGGEASGLKRAWTASRKRIGRWTRGSAHFRILV